MGSWTHEHIAFTGGKIFPGPHLDPWPWLEDLEEMLAPGCPTALSVGAAGHIFCSGVADVSLHPYGEVRAEFVSVGWR